MPPTLSNTWRNNKYKFFSQYNFNSYVRHAIRDIEGQMDNLSFWHPNPIERFKAKINLTGTTVDILICVCITNKILKEFAPAYLYIISSQENQELLPPTNEAIKAIKDVKTELGW